ALLIAGWVIIGRQAALWMLALVLLNLSLMLYWSQVLEGVGMIGAVLGPLAGLGMTLADARLGAWVFLLNTTALVIWEVCAARGIAGTEGRWFPRVAAIGALVPVVAGSWVFIMGVSLDVGWAPFADMLLLLGFIGGCFWYYRSHVRDLLILTLCVASVIVLVTSYFGRVMEFDDDTAILLAILLVAQTAGAAILLRNIHRSWQSK
ncbi:MAG: hypothetical protein OEQ74_04750, partial [Gammaproteobacteria bacterium]|nr:hypothetical protein [Gammaproteobacteria bacterium]